MEFTVKKISIVCDNTFTGRDIIHGQVVVEIAKKTEINSLLVRFVGKAKVKMRDPYGWFWFGLVGALVMKKSDHENYTTEQFIILDNKGKGKVKI